ncbi:hypothetical protein Glove_543g30 [Diversispora epigaea]|uniref:Protein kinase domain-containing protein n=1 Tax=Diversispora epigaea TaxID=1348612 RepID=A0A397GG92_9GLOM|nr:hypothetical protein Glove_543g30 [Diversispora epigaea]
MKNVTIRRTSNREYLKINFNNINWLPKLYDLFKLSKSSERLKNIYKLGLGKLIGVNPNNPEKKNIFGVLPYIAPEALSGEEYTKAVYSYGIIAYEIVTGIP